MATDKPKLEMLGDVSILHDTIPVIYMNQSVNTDRLTEVIGMVIGEGFDAKKLDFFGSCCEDINCLYDDDILFVIRPGGNYEFVDSATDLRSRFGADVPV